MIHVVGYQKSQQKYLLDLTRDKARELSADPDVLLWIDIEAANSETEDAQELSRVSDFFHLDPLALEDCWHPRQASKLEAYDHYLFMIVNTVNGACSTVGPCDLLELDCFLSERFLITYHTGPIPAIEAAKQQCQKHTSWLAKGTASLAYGILDQFIDMYLPVLDSLDDQLSQLEQEILMSTSFTQASGKTYLRLSRQILDLRRTSVKAEQVFYQLSHSPSPFIDKKEARLFKDIYDHVIRVADLSEHYQQTLRSNLEIHLSLSSNRVNQVAQFLTVIATIMLPLSVITGIYGMNFEWMPLLHWRYGFHFMILFMAALAIAMVLWFRHKKWV